MKKKKGWIIALILIILLLLLVILYLLFGKDRSFTITFDTDGGNEITSVEVNNGEIVKLPEAPTKEGYKFVGWTNKDGNFITEGTKVTEDITLKANWVSNDAEIVTAKYTDEDNNIIDVLIEKGTLIILPVAPEKEGYIFVCWLDGNGNFITEDYVVTDNIVLTAMWIKKDAKTVTITFDTGGSNIGSIVIESGKIILLPVDPTKNGYVFRGWVDEKGNEITKDTKVDKNMTIKAVWKEPYTCPKDCTPIEDGSKCTKTTTKELIVYTGCPSGTETVEKFCSSHKRQVAVGFDEDQTTVDAGISCSGNPTNFCVDYNSRYTKQSSGCPSGYFSYNYSESGLDAEYGCAKKYDTGGKNCPSGYTMDGEVCKKTETINCTAN